MKKLTSAYYHKHFLLIIISLFAVDQVSKMFAVMFLPENEVFLPKVFGIIGLKYAKNTGLILGWLDDYSFTIWLGAAINVMGIVVMVWIYLYLRKKKMGSFLLSIGIAFEIASNLGAFFDRIVLGYAIDFLTWFGPGIFNLADVWGVVAKFFFLMVLIHPQKYFYGRDEDHISSRIRK